MKKNFLFALGALLSSALLFTACGNDDTDDEAVDVRDCAVGNFNGTISTYWLVDGEFEADEEAFGKPESINLTIAKDGTNEKAIQLNVDGDIFYGSKIEAASNGFGFDIESQSFEGMTIAGYNAGTVGTTKYNGVYMDDTKELTVGFKISIKDFVSFSTEDIEDEDEKATAQILLNGTFTELGAEAIVMVIDANKR